MDYAIAILVALFALQSDQRPEWCRDLPRPGYSKLERVNVPDKWFEVYRIHPGLFAIYEPHQQEEIISLPDRRRKASFALRYRHGHQQYQESCGRPYQSAGKCDELSYAQ